MLSSPLISAFLVMACLTTQSALLCCLASLKLFGWNIDCVNLLRFLGLLSWLLCIGFALYQQTWRCLKYRQQVKQSAHVVCQEAAWLSSKFMAFCNTCSADVHQPTGTESSTQQVSGCLASSHWKTWLSDYPLIAAGMCPRDPERMLENDSQTPLLL